MSPVRQVVDRIRGAVMPGRTMSCRDVGRVLQLYLDGRVLEDGTVGGQQAAAIAEHLELCRRCGLEEDTYRRIKAALGAGVITTRPNSVVAAPLDDAATARLREFGEQLARGEGPVDPGEPGPPD